MIDPRLTRVDENRLRVENPQGVDATLFARHDVPVESAAIDEFLTLLELEQTVERFAEHHPDAFDKDPGIRRVALTPDFHKARGIPVGTALATQGFLVPQAIGNDINCGMRLHTTSLDADRVVGHLDELETAFRHIFFQGGRNIPMSRNQREALFQGGLSGLLDATPSSLDEGLWSLFHEAPLERELDRVEHRGSLPAREIVGLEDFLGPDDHLSRDNQIGSIGGGNHFVEFQAVDRVLDGTTAHAWGLEPGKVVLMIHTGSVSIGHLCGSAYRDAVRQLFPTELKHPDNGIFILPQGERFRPQQDLFWDGLHNAANFAFANRLFLSLMAWSGLRRIWPDVDLSLLYDAPHNLLWKDQFEGEDVILHRKGCCPARGYEAMAETPFAYHGEPVLVPGSMGASSFILAGRGNQNSLHSASHGAGRQLSRGDAMRGHDHEFRSFLDNFRIVTPVDLRRQDIRLRRDILEKKMLDLKQEAPFAYKGIGPVIETLSEARVARPVVELKPLMTIKG